MSEFIRKLIFKNYLKGGGGSASGAVNRCGSSYEDACKGSNIVECPTGSDFDCVGRGGSCYHFPAGYLDIDGCVKKEITSSACIK